MTMPLVDESGLTMAAVPARADVADVIVTAGGGGRTGADAVRALRPGARVATGSLRRRCQLLAIRPDLDVVGIRGNVDTRLRRWRDGACDAVVLAAAGLVRAGLLDPAVTARFDPDQMVPSAGQGALALQCRADDAGTVAALSALDDPGTRAAVDAERRVVALLGADCHSPLGVYARPDRQGLRVTWAVGAAGGVPPVSRATVSGRGEHLNAALAAAVAGDNC